MPGPAESFAGATHRLRPGHDTGPSHPFPGGHHHHHGALYPQDAAIGGDTESPDRGRGLEGYREGRHGGIPEVCFQDCRKFFGEAIVVTQDIEDILVQPYRQERYPQQCRHQDPAGHEQVRPPLRRDHAAFRTEGP
jgi:hypothetical protein